MPNMPSGDRECEGKEGGHSKALSPVLYVFGKCPTHLIVLVYEANLARKSIHDLQGIGC